MVKCRVFCHFEVLSKNVREFFAVCGCYKYSEITDISKLFWADCRSRYRNNRYQTEEENHQCREAGSSHSDVGSEPIWLPALTRLISLHSITLGLSTLNEARSMPFVIIFSNQKKTRMSPFSLRVNVFLCL